MNAEKANGGGPLLCTTCRWWYRLDDESGECRRHPPTVVPIFAEAMSCWPITHDDEWCGEWQPAGKGPVLVSGGDAA